MKENEKLQILKSVLELEVKKGHLKWTMSELARKSKVTRTLIYYHFGNTKTEIVKYALEIMGEEFFSVSESGSVFLNEIDLEKSLRKTREKLQKNAYVLTFYYFWRYSDSPIRGYLEQMELKFQKRLGKALPQYTKKEIIAIHTVMFGIVVAPFLSDNVSFQKILIILKNELNSSA